MDMEGIRNKEKGGGYINHMSFGNTLKERENYRRKSALIKIDFEQDLREVVNTAIKREMTDEQWKPFFRNVWEAGHSNGYSEIIIYADNLIDVIKPFL